MMHQLFVNVYNIRNIAKNVLYKNKEIIASLIKKSIKSSSYKKVCYFHHKFESIILFKFITVFINLINLYN